MFRIIFFIPILIVSTTISSILAILGGIFNPYSLFNTAVIKSWAKSLLWGAGVKVEIAGINHIVQNISYVVIANHQSHMDIPVLAAALPIPLRIISKKELFRIPLLGWGMKGAGMLSIDRSNRKKSLETLKEAEKMIKEHKLSILAFPEGTRSNDGKIHPFKKGPIILGINTQLPLLPVSVSGTRKIIPKGKVKIHGGRVKVYVHPSISTEELSLTDRNKLLEEVQETIEKGFIENYG